MFRHKNIASLIFALYLFTFTFPSRSPAQSVSSNFANLNNVRYASGFPGADAGAKIAAAIADLPANGGTIDARGFGATTQSVSATITVGAIQTLLCDPATTFQPASAALDMFTVNVNGKIRGCSVDVTNQPAYSGKVFKFTDDYRDGNVTSLEDIRILADGVTTGVGIYLAGSDSGTQSIAFLSLAKIRIWGLSKGLQIVGSGSVGFVNGNHFSDIQISGSVRGIDITTSGTGQVDGNLFSNISYQYKAASTQYGLYIDSNSGGLIVRNQFLGLDIWDTPAALIISGAGSTTNLLIGRFDGTTADNENNKIWNVFTDQYAGRLNVDGLLDLKPQSSRFGFTLTGPLAGTDGATQTGILVQPTLSPVATTTNVQSIWVMPDVVAGAGVTITNRYGLRVSAGSKTGAGTLTNAYGLYVENPAGGTNTYTAFLEGQTGIGKTPGANAQLDVAKSIVSGVNTVTFSATPTFDASLGNTQKITLTGNVTSSTLSNASTGQTINFLIRQDATGSRTFVWPTNVKGGMTIGATLNTCSAQSFIFDGTNAYATGAGVTNM